MTRQAVLFTPGDERRMVEKALTSDADMVILDIEDSVAPSAKDEACETVRSVLTEWDTADVSVEVSVRINALSERGRDDLAVLAAAGDAIETVVLPKVSGREAVDELEELFEAHGYGAAIVPLIETPEAILEIQEIAAHPLVVAFEFGAEDYTTEIGAVQTDARSEITYARQKIVTAAAAADIDALDMAWPDFHDDEGLRRNAEEAVQFGYDGKSAIHPSQIPIIKEAFTPTDDELERSRVIVDGARAAQREGKVVFQLDGEMIDPPIVERAIAVLERGGESVDPIYD